MTDNNPRPAKQKMHTCVCNHTTVRKPGEEEVLCHLKPMNLQRLEASTRKREAPFVPPSCPTLMHTTDRSIRPSLPDPPAYLHSNARKYFFMCSGFTALPVTCPKL